MSRRIPHQQLESYLWGAATLLRGTIDAGDYKQFVFPLLFFKRLCDVFDEETRLALKKSGGDVSGLLDSDGTPIPKPTMRSALCHARFISWAATTVPEPLKGQFIAYAA
jgi:type I restriction-modification system DNA methylase subunit